MDSSRWMKRSSRDCWQPGGEAKRRRDPGDLGRERGLVDVDSDAGDQGAGTPPAPESRRTSFADQTSFGQRRSGLRSVVRAIASEVARPSAIESTRRLSSGMPAAARWKHTVRLRARNAKSVVAALARRLLLSDNNCTGAQSGARRASPLRPSSSRKSPAIRFRARGRQRGSYRGQAASVIPVRAGN